MAAELVYEFRQVNYTWQNAAQQKQFYDNKYYENCAPAGIKIDKGGQVYVTVPRYWKAGVPATLNKVSQANTR